MDEEGLSERDRAVLDLAGRQWPAAGVRERAIRERLGISPTLYYQLLNALLDDPRALEAYQKGKEYFYTRRGQLNFSCATCHVQSPGERIRAEVLAPALGILNAMPIYRSEWAGMGTTSRRFTPHRL